MPASESHAIRRTVVLLATLDSKRAESAYLAESIRSRGHEVLLADLALRPGSHVNRADISRDEIAAAAGATWTELSELPRAEAMKVVARGAGALVRELADAHRVHAVVGIGGGTGSWLCTAIMAALPHGFPKLMVSTKTGQDASRDIAVMTSVVDIAGVNRLLAPVLANAAAAISGMAEGVATPEPDSKPAIAVTMFGVTTEGATHLRRFLEHGGFEVITFHANGFGGRTMERLIREGAFTAVLDWTTSEITDELTGGACTAGLERLDAAAQTGIPQIVVPGAVDVINLRPPIPERFEARTHHWHLPTTLLVRTTAEESERIGAWTAAKLNAATGPVRVLVPGLGFSALDRPDGEFRDPDADEAWLRGLRSALNDAIPVEVLPLHINDEAFARATADRMLELLREPQPAGRS